MKKKIGVIAALTTVSAISPVYASDDIKAYTTTLYELDDRDARSKKIRLIYAVENVWNKTARSSSRPSAGPSGHKEVRLILKGGSGFDMTNVPSKETTYSFSTGGDYRYTVPTAFKLGISSVGGSPLRHISHAPENTISKSTVSENLEFNLGLSGTAAADPSLGASAGVSYAYRVTYDQPEFRTTADFEQRNETVEWMIENQTINNRSPAKANLLYRYTYCGDNLLAFNKLPAVMRSDFKPQVGAVYRQRNINDWRDTSYIKLTAEWRKTDYYFAQDWCSWYTTFTWKNRKDRHHWTSANRTVAVSWRDSLYR